MSDLPPPPPEATPPVPPAGGFTPPPGPPYYAAQPGYPQPAPGNGKALWSLILGIASIPLSCCCIGLVLGILAIVFGAQAKKEVDRGSATSGAGQAQAGLICGIVGVALTVVLTMVALVLNLSDGGYGRY